tara:strand:- start:19799 stop:20011 length:213 start_codon:yes stop_codon:yes gene_type:complete
MLKKVSKMQGAQQILFAIIIGVAVISFWRGIWGLMDEYLFPNNLEISYTISVLIGILILYITHYIVRELT